MTPTTKSSSGLRLCPDWTASRASEQRGCRRGRARSRHRLSSEMAPAAMSIRLATSEAVPRPPPKRAPNQGWSVVPGMGAFEPLSCVDLAQVQSGIRGVTEMAVNPFVPIECGRSGSTVVDACLPKVPLCSSS